MALHPNHDLMVKVREQGINQRLFHLYDNAFPEAYQNHKYHPIKRGLSFEQLQHEMGERLIVNKDRLDKEYFTPESRVKRYLKLDGTFEHMPTMTMGSDWYRMVAESKARHNNGRGPILINNQRFVQ